MNFKTKTINFLILLCAGLAIYFDFVGNWNMFRIFKPLTTILIIVLSLTNYKNRDQKYTQYILIGLVFCLFGDVFLLYEKYFVFGLSSFLLAHILFTIGFISIHKLQTYLMPLIVLLLIGISYYLFIYPSLNDLTFPVLVYFCVIIFMCWQGISLYIWRKEKVFKLIAIAVILFLISDSILAFNKFKMHFDYSGILILTTYWLSISLLANSTLFLKDQEKESLF